MSAGKHHYRVLIEWTGNQGTGTSGYKAYSRNYDVAVPGTGKPAIAASADPAFRGDADRWNPEDLLVASIAACHKLWYLHLCAVSGIVVTSYRDEATGQMETVSNGSGRFLEVILRPQITIAAGDKARAEALHHEAHAMCFVANSLNFPVRCEPEITLEH